MIFANRHISGVSFNPSGTLAFASIGRFSGAAEFFSRGGD